MKIRILVGHVLDRLRAMPADSVHCVVTSPPYWGLRAYGTEPQVWGGDACCEHEWGDQLPGDGRRGQRGETSIIGERKVSDPQVEGRQAARGAFCARCGAWRGEHGLERTLDLWLEHEVMIFREVRRVLRPDGTLWLNVGDAYATTPNGNAAASYRGKDDRAFRDKPVSTAGALASKQRLMLPARLALALQADGWWLRDEIVWAKPNPMPSSVDDRTTPAHEMLYLLTKRARYFFDAVAIAEPAEYGDRGYKMPDGWDTGAGGHGSIHRAGREKGRPARSGGHPGGWATEGSDRSAIAHARGRAAGNKTHKTAAADADGSLAGHQHAGMLDIANRAYGTRNKRSVWTITTEPFAEAHFATMPTELARQAILAGTSERGVCAVCGAPWQRVTVGRLIPQPDAPASATRREGQHAPDTMWTGTERGVVERETIGWYPTCACTLDPPLLPYPRRPKRSEHVGDEAFRDAKAFWEAQCAMVDQGRREQCAAVAIIERRVTVPATVLDPFGGSGTTALVADRLGRAAVIIELNPEYAALASRRIAGDAPLLAADRLEVDP